MVLVSRKGREDTTHFSLKILAGFERWFCEFFLVYGEKETIETHRGISKIQTGSKHHTFLIKNHGEV